MTVQEAIDMVIRSMSSWKHSKEMHDKVKDKKWAQPTVELIDKHITACEMAIEALEKQIPQRTIKDGYDEHDEVCPRCGNKLWLTVDFCEYCGQALDWEREDDEVY